MADASFRTPTLRAEEVSSAPDALLQLRGVGLEFGSLQAVRDVSLDVSAGEIVGVVGPNGAGKTSLLNCIVGLYRASRGSVTFRDIDITRKATHEIVRLGIGRTFQHVELVPSLSVFANLLLALQAHRGVGYGWNLIGFGPARKNETRAASFTSEMLTNLGLDGLASRPVAELSYWEQKQLAFARALLPGPGMLLLDEPGAGLSEDEKAHFSSLIESAVSQTGVAVLFVEHDLRMVTNLCNRLMVMDAGAKLAEGVPQEVLASPSVRRAYLGQRTV